MNLYFEIPLNESFFIKHHLSIFDSLYLEHHKKNKNNITIGSIFFFISILFIMADSNAIIGYIVLTSSLNLIFYHFALRKKLKKNRVNQLSNLQQLAQEFKEKPILIVYELTDDYLMYKDFRWETKVYWTSFKSYREIDEVIFLDLQDVKFTLYYSIALEEIGKEKYETVLNIIKNKVKSIT